MKIAVIGAGSVVLCKTLVLDVLATPSLEETEFALMAPSRRRTPHVQAFVQRAIEANGMPARARAGRPGAGDRGPL
jgi:alpha-galactosidase